MFSFIMRFMVNKIGSTHIILKICFQKPKTSHPPPPPPISIYISLFSGDYCGSSRKCAPCMFTYCILNYCLSWTYAFPFSLARSVCFCRPGAFMKYQVTARTIELGDRLQNGVGGSKADVEGVKGLCSKRYPWGFFFLRLVKHIGVRTIKKQLLYSSNLCYSAVLSGGCVAQLKSKIIITYSLLGRFLFHKMEHVGIELRTLSFELLQNHSVIQPTKLCLVPPGMGLNQEPIER